MCGYDPLYWYEWEIDRQALANDHGFDTYEEYINWLDDNKTDSDFESRNDR